MRKTSSTERKSDIIQMELSYLGEKKKRHWMKEPATNI